MYMAFAHTVYSINLHERRGNLIQNTNPKLRVNIL